MYKRNHLILFSSLLLSVAFAASEDQRAFARPFAVANDAPQVIAGLGTTAFATTTQSPQAQAAFLRGLLLLHLFEYSDAADAFVAAEKLDPAFSMAYWGEAMSFNHGVWNQVDVAAGKGALDKLATSAPGRAARSPDPREAAYLTAVDLLYDGRGSKIERDRRYAEAMESLSRRYPEDRNAQLFYALALLGQSEGIRDVPVYLHAAEISKAIFRLEPDNPGAAHYWIHGMDDPEHAAGALEAARALSKIAPNAPHGRHMCSHIFMALGMWDDVVAANLESMRVLNEQDKASGYPGYHCGHVSNWLLYGYLEQGRLREARQAITDCRQTVTDTAAWVAAHGGQAPYHSRSAARLHQDLVEHALYMRGMERIDARDWSNSGGGNMDVTGIAPDAAAWEDFTAGFAAAQTGDSAKAAEALAAMQSKIASYSSGHDVDPQDLKALTAGKDELAGLVDIKSGKEEAGLAELRRACETYRAMAFDFGPPVTIKPPDEMLGEVLLDKGEGAGARDAFEQSLRRAPMRTESLLGLARAQRLTGDSSGSGRTYQILAAIWHDADARVPGLEEARAASSATLSSR